MIDQNKKLLGIEARDNVNCCNNSSCCGTKNPIKRTTPKISRNEPCPCGSGRKYKKCCT